jgi:hypothetical protein
MNIERWCWYSIAINVLLGLLHGFIAFTSDSLAVAAERGHPPAIRDLDTCCTEMTWNA